VCEVLARGQPEEARIAQGYFRNGNASALLVIRHCLIVLRVYVWHVQISDIRDTRDTRDSRALSKLTFGDGGGSIKKDKCTGGNFEVGGAVVYEGKQCIVSKAVDSDGDLKVSFPVTVEVGMTEGDFSGAKMGESGAIILAGWLEHKVQHMIPTDYC
jgi:hypothetical protein